MSENSTSSFTFWVCVFRRLRDGVYRTAICSNLKSLLQKEQGEEQLMYFRLFTDMQAAIGFKLFLQSLKGDTVERNIRTINPLMKDLFPYLTDYYR